MDSKEKLIALKAKLEMLDELGKAMMFNSNDGSIPKAISIRTDLVNKIENIEATSLGAC